MNLYVVNYQENRSMKMPQDPRIMCPATKYIFANNEQEAFDEVIKFTKLFNSLMLVVDNIDQAVNYPK